MWLVIFFNFFNSFNFFNFFNLLKESLIRNADVDAWLMVILAVQEAVTVLCLDHNLLYRHVVDASRNTLHLGIAVAGVLRVRSIGIVALVASEDVEFITVSFRPLTFVLRP